MQENQAIKADYLAVFIKNFNVWSVSMYKKHQHIQQTIYGFGQPLGLELDPENRWVTLAALIPWDELEDKYADLFPSKNGTIAKPFRMALGALIIQMKYQFSDRELVDQIVENPYYQHFIGLPKVQRTAMFNASSLVNFRKRISPEIISEVNEIILTKLKKENNSNSKN